MFSSSFICTLPPCTAFISASRLPSGPLFRGVSVSKGQFYNTGFSCYVTFDFCLAFFLFLFGGFGITGGAHRLWAHRCYKAKWPLRLFAAVAQTIAVQVTANLF